MNARSGVPSDSTTLLDNLLRRAPLDVFLFDTDLICRYAAPAGDEFLGQRRDQFIGRHATEILAPAADRLRDALERALHERLPWQDHDFRFTVHGSSGKTSCCWAIEVEPMADEDYQGIMVTLADMTDLIEERDRLRDEVADLRQRENERSRAFAEMVVNVRELLAPPLGYLQVIARRPHILRGRSPAAVITKHVLPRLNELVDTLARAREPQLHGSNG